ncbi:MAG: thioredoxin fold domain-containing protein [Candidatus Krumholzibacteria bacterium]|nr:thioredoxin fold domain-containing protein [Candidatus Krumholzibacteria bacterium]
MKMIPRVLILVFFLLACGEKQGESVSGGIQWMDYESGVALAKSEGKPVLIDFWTSWCHWCKVLDEETYSQKIVQDRLAESFVAIKVNAESKDAQGEGEEASSGVELARQYNVKSYPTTWFLDSEGKPLAPVPGFQKADDFVIILDYVSTGAYRDTSFQDYLSQNQGEEESQ